MRLLSAAATCVFVLALGGGGCSQAGPPEFGKADVDNINKMLQEYAAAYNAKDALKVSQMFTGAAVVMPPNSSTVRGQENVRDYYVKRFNQGRRACRSRQRTSAATVRWRLSAATTGSTSRLRAAKCAATAESFSSSCGTSGIGGCSST